MLLFFYANDINCLGSALIVFTGKLLLELYQQILLSIFPYLLYTFCEKGTNECHNKMLRRFIPKGKSINDYSADDIMYFADKINNLPRKILNYHTPEELFERQLDKIYAA